MSRNNDDTSRFGSGFRPSGAFAKYAGHRIAITVRHGAECRVLTGTASFGCERMLGNVLRIQLDEPSDGSPVLILGESDWEGHILSESHHGCDYSLVLDRN